MPQKTKQVGVRLTAEEAEFLAELKIENAATPSDKLRAIIDDAMRRKLGTEDYEASLKLILDMLAPTTRIIRSSENTHHMHSELVSRMSDWVPECMAYLIASNGAETELDQQQLRDIEAKYPGLEHVMFQYPEGMPLAEFKDQIRRLGEEVMPAFTSSATAAAD